MTKKSKTTHWVSLFIDRKTVAYFDSFEIEYISQEVSFTIYLEGMMMVLLCVDFIVLLS